MKKYLILVLTLLLPINSSAAMFDAENTKLPQIKRIELISFSPENQSAVFDVDVYNPNDFKLPVRELTGEVHLNEQHVASLQATSKSSLAALSTQTFKVPISVKPDAMLLSAQQILLSGRAEYLFKGYMMTPVGELPIQHQGQLDSQQIVFLLNTILFSQTP
jgi:hypothetical protein